MGADEICAQAWALWNSLCGKALIAPQTQALTKMLNLEKNADYRLLLTPDSFS
ncbi:hypothetical protein GCM10027217_46200 [Pseudomaricurvus hydrocarbonicus]